MKRYEPFPWQCAQRKKVRHNVSERCLRAAGHRPPHVYASARLDTILKLCALLDQATAR